MSAPLTERLPPRQPPAPVDDILGRFVDYVAGRGLELYPAQEEAILELLAGKHLILKTPTGSGKSLVAQALIFKSMSEGRRTFVTFPIKALASEKFFELCEAFGPDLVGMMTGDAGINREAPIICCTAEVLANLCLRDPDLQADAVVMDEFHFYADKERGVAWQLPLLALPRTTFLLMSATLGDTRTIEVALEKSTGREVAVVQSSIRPVPLDFEYVETPLHETIEKLISTHRYPVYLVNFTQRAAAEQVQNLTSANYSTREEKEAVRQAIGDFRFDTPYGKDIQRYLRHGLGLHHAGLLPKYRLLVEKLAQAGHLKVISGTDTLGVGVNIPIRSVLFTQLCKFDGQKTGILPVREFRQIAGRAGRKGFDDRGAVVVQAPEHVIENLRMAAKPGKKQVKRQPPDKGYVHWDRATFDRLVSREPEPLESRFRVNHGTVLNVLQGAALNSRGQYGRLVEIIRSSHESAYNQRHYVRTAAEAFRTLRGAGVIELVGGEGRRGRQARIHPGLQRDFSLFHTLSLYLFDTLARLDPTSETYALDLLSIVEAILESPDAVLYKQLDKLKREKVAEMKAKGIEYDQRMEELEKMEHPKPLAPFIYETFNAFSDRHPWVGTENIRPKSIAREMFEKYASFSDYVVEYSLQRSEGVLLRYLAEVYKTLAQNVPDSFRTEEVLDLLLSLRTTLRETDSSLIDEWESLRTPGPELVQGPRIPPPPVDPLADPKALAARVRVECHRLVKALAVKDYAAAVQGLVPGEAAWTAESLAEAAAPLWEQYQGLDLTPRARKASLTQLRPSGARCWDVVHRLLDPAGEGDLSIEGRVDLSLPREVDGPLLELRGIG